MLEPDTDSIEGTSYFWKVAHLLTQQKGTFDFYNIKSTMTNQTMTNQTMTLNVYFTRDICWNT